jgi:hypothetical protein
MEQEKIMQKISSIENEIVKISRILSTIKELDLSAADAAYESFASKAAMKSEKITCGLRHLIYATTNITKPELMKKAAGVHEIDIKYNDGIFSVTFPALLLRKEKKLSNEFIIDPLYYALDEYFSARTIEKFGECVVVFEHIYDMSSPKRRVRDYDNLELKAVLDTVSAFAMTDDGGKFCEVFHTTGYAENDCTKISVMTKNMFREWLAKQ